MEGKGKLAAATTAAWQRTVPKEMLTKSAFLTRPNPTSTDRPDPGLVGRDKIKPIQTKGWSVGIYPDQFQCIIYWSGYIPTSPDLAQNYSGLVYVEHCAGAHYILQILEERVVWAWGSSAPSSTPDSYIYPSSVVSLMGPEFSTGFLDSYMFVCVAHRPSTGFIDLYKFARVAQRPRV